MKCETFENYLDGYLDGSLSELEQQAMQEHMQNCPGCRKRYEEQRLLLEELRHLDDGVRAPEGLVAGTMERIRRERRPRRRTRPYWIGGGIAAALCLTLALGTFLGGAMNATSSAPKTSLMNMAATTEMGWDLSLIHICFVGEIGRAGRLELEHIQQQIPAKRYVLPLDQVMMQRKGQQSFQRMIRHADDLLM